MFRKMVVLILAPHFSITMELLSCEICKITFFLEKTFRGVFLDRKEHVLLSWIGSEKSYEISIRTEYLLTSV